METQQLNDEISVLKEETSTIILAHYYQVLDVQDVGDFLGDSLGLSRKAAEIQDAKHIIFAAVDFMAEVAKILNPTKMVLLPDMAASCPMANQLRAAQVKDYKAEHPGLPVVLYINTLAEAKAECDVICTSSNAVEVCQAVARDWNINTILMGPDKNLSYHVEQHAGIQVITMPEKGCCYVHDQFSIEDVNLQRERYPHAKLVVHPECKPEIQDSADFVGSTTQMIKHVEAEMASHDEFIIGTEQGLIDHLQRKYPELKLHSLAPVEGGIWCKNMKKTTLAKIHELLLNIQSGTTEEHEVTVEPEIAARAKKAIDAMFEYSAASG
ncbi:MAG TPA: quinolinate synthase NadA [Candidatus Lokiarchaeia archaeon]|nr:quinolinate synthase NadA [Candidatus Lokiarchaeia archaeon]